MMPSPNFSLQLVTNCLKKFTNLTFRINWSRNSKIRCGNSCSIAKCHSDVVPS